MAMMTPAPGTGQEDRLALVAPTTDFSRPETFEHLPGGEATHRKSANRNSFSHASANMGFRREFDFKIGNGVFRKLWVSSPASTKSSDGLGPLYNARACQRCHLKDGRGRPPAVNAADDKAVSMFLRLSVPPQTEAEKQAIAAGKLDVVPEPTYGGQLQNFAIQGLSAEGQMKIVYEPVTVTLGDGETVTLRKPSYSIEDLGYGPMHPDAMTSPRIANQMIGLGLLEAVRAEDILNGADPEDRDGDGISGRARMVWSTVQNRLMLGRFGWKSGKVSIEEQTAGAFAGDIGLSTPIHKAASGDCTARQGDCLKAPNGNAAGDGGTEVSRKLLDLVVFYAKNLAVPQRRNAGDADVLAGKHLFYESGCIRCHRPKFITRSDDKVAPEQRGQLIWPYSDMLLHDMGEGLADNRPEGTATGREWRTAPLWGIGHTKIVSGHTFFLHDGRARNLLEAILWHGGEAEAAKQAVVAMTAAQRRQLIGFLNSL